ncbi:MAG: DUF309 domain-containing protein [Verrucomicrobiales bacterium]|nr:DUF309 domain-containing protein [Verrucomicrobiales bacterium]
MSKADRIAHLRVEGPGGLNPHYAGYFACFNRGEYFEAHDVLEALWLGERKTPNDLFYKGLIQLAGAFVHLKKSRLRPADALFRLAWANLVRYRPVHERLDVEEVLGLIVTWREDLARGGFAENPLSRRPPPQLAPLTV